MTAHSDAAEAATERQRQEAMPPGPPVGDSNAQARRAHAPAREAEHNTPESTEREPGKRVETPEWVNQVARYLGRQAFMRHEPALPGEVWQRVAARAGQSDGWLPTLGIYVGGAVGYAITGMCLGIAWLVRLPVGGGAVSSLHDLWTQIEEIARDRDSTKTGGAVRLAGGVSWAITAACYGVAYTIQFPALLAALAVCAGVAALTLLF